MKTVYFATHNKGKLLMAREIVKELKLPLSIKHLDVEYPEDKSVEDFSHIAKTGAKFCAEKYKKPVFTTDVGIEIEILSGFPGINTAFTLKRIGVEGIVKLMEGKKNRKIRACLALSYCRPGGNPRVWRGEINGTIPKSPRGEKGFGWDPIFIPEKSDITFAEDPKIRNKVFSFREGISEMYKWLQK
ncbi:MAG: non-canonical purine NTP pyrophosphatase [bacterium]|nr:non-canonical purine NTP pyrophosphatase [bacterium]